MDYNFFDYKETFTEVHDKFGTAHIITICLAFVLIIVACFLMRKLSRKQVGIFLKVWSIIAFIAELGYQIWDAYWSFRYGNGDYLLNGLPIFTCTMYLYCVIIAAWTKGKVQRVSLAFLTTTSLMCGISGLIQLNGLNFYPFWTFGAFNSIFFHFSMAFIGAILLATKYVVIEWKDIIRAYIPLIILAVIAIPVDYVLHADYMQVYSAIGVPVLCDLATILSAHNLRWLFTIIFMILYIPFGAIPIAIIKLVYYIITKTTHKEIAPSGE